jgi:hypothetical protein
MRLVKWIWAALLLVACTDKPDIPSPPDLTELRAVYAEPTGALTLDTLIQTVQQIEEMGQPKADYDELSFLPDLLEKLDEVAQEEGGINFGRIELEGDAYGILTMLCEEDADGEDGGAGEASVHFVVNEKGMDPNLWGSVVDCNWSTKVSDSDTRLMTLFNGEFQIFLIDQTGFVPNEDEWIVEFDGEVSFGSDDSEKLVFDFWWNQGAMTTRVPLVDGSWFFVGYTPGTLRYLFQDTQGTIDCDFKERECTTDDHPIGSFTF